LLFFILSSVYLIHTLFIIPSIIRLKRIGLKLSPCLISMVIAFVRVSDFYSRSIVFISAMTLLYFSQMLCSPIGSKTSPRCTLWKICLRSMKHMNSDLLNSRFFDKLSYYIYGIYSRSVISKSLFFAYIRFFCYFPASILICIFEIECYPSVVVRGLFFVPFWRLVLLSMSSIPVSMIFPKKVVISLDI